MLRLCQYAQLCALVTAALCAAWCAGALPDVNVRTVAALATGADTSSADSRCASMNDCYTTD